MIEFYMSSPPPRLARQSLSTKVRAPLAEPSLYWKHIPDTGCIGTQQPMEASRPAPHNYIIR